MLFTVKTPLGLLLVPEPHLQEILESYQALLTAKTWGEFRSSVSPEMYRTFAVRSEHYNQREDILPSDELAFTPNDFFSMESPEFICNPEIEMSEWVPEEIQKEYGKHTRYYAMDGNVPKGKILELDVTRMEEIIAALERHGYTCQRDDGRVSAIFGPEFDPDDYPRPTWWDEEDEE